MYVAFEYLTLLAAVSIVGFILFSLTVAVLAAQEGATRVRQAIPIKLRQWAPRMPFKHFAELEDPISNRPVHSL